MPEVVVFCEDSFHEKFIGPLLRRVAAEHAVELRLHFLSAQGGLPRMHSEFKTFLRDLQRQSERLPDLILAVADANCKGYNERKADMEKAVEHYPAFQGLVMYAIPDPHIERWMLVDPDAFRTVFGRGCTLPALKCKKDEYNWRLRDEIRLSGIDAPLGGEEFAEDVVSQINLPQVEIREASLGLLLKELRARFNRWRQS